MNLSQLITRLKVNLGLYTLATPFENLDAAIKETIENITLRTFSTFYPYYETFRFDLHSLERIERHADHETYLLPDLFSEREILFIRNVSYDESDISALGYWGAGIPLLHGNLVRQGMMANAGLALSNRMVPRLTFKYEHPRKVTIYNALVSAKLVFEIALMHDKNLASISPTQEEAFYDLALLDVKILLYNTMKHYNDIQTATGSIQLKLDDWSSAESDRKALLEDWGNIFHIDVMPFEYL